MNGLTGADIRQHWDAVRAPIAECLAGDEDRPEDLYAACVYNDAAFYIAHDGFVVLRKRTTRLGAELRVWVGYCTGETGALARYGAELQRLAREISAVRIVFETRRAGFDRRLPEGWRRAASIYEMEVSHG